MVPDIGDITADHIPTAIHAMTEVAVLEGTPSALLPATAAACTALQPMDTLVTPHTTVAPHLAFTTFSHLHRLELVSLQQLPPHNTRSPIQESQATPKTQPQ